MVVGIKLARRVSGWQQSPHACNAATRLYLHVQIVECSAAQYEQMLEQEQGE